MKIPAGMVVQWIAQLPLSTTVPGLNQAGAFLCSLHVLHMPVLISSIKVSLPLSLTQSHLLIRESKTARAAHVNCHLGISMGCSGPQLVDESPEFHIFISTHLPFLNPSRGGCFGMEVKDIWHIRSAAIFPCSKQWSEACGDILAPSCLIWLHHARRYFWELYPRNWIYFYEICKVSVWQVKKRPGMTWIDWCNVFNIFSTARERDDGCKHSGLIAVAVFYMIILGTGIWASRKSKKEEKRSTGTGTEVTLVAGRNINLAVGIFTMTGECAAVSLWRTFEHLI